MTQETVANLSRKWERWYNEAQTDSLVSLYAPEAYIVSEGNPVIFGLENIEAYYSEQFKKVNGKIEIFTESVHICSDIAIERGKWNLKVGTTNYSGSFLTQWKLIDGEWLTELDISLNE
jgi:ketosteroid isomerase-like protein